MSSCPDGQFANDASDGACLGESSSLLLLASLELTFPPLRLLLRFSLQLLLWDLLWLLNLLHLVRFDLDKRRSRRILLADDVSFDYDRRGRGVLDLSSRL